MDRLSCFILPPTWAGPLVIVVVVVVVAFLVLRIDWIRKTLKINKASSKPSHPSPTKPDTQFNLSSYYAITPLPNFSLNTTAPLKLRPFKPKYHMTMGLENLPFSSLLPFDDTYATRLTLRRTLLEQHTHEVLACTARATPTVLELYTYLTSHYLPTRYPTLFAKTAHDTLLLNKLTHTRLPLHFAPTQENARLALRLLSENVDSEFMLLLASPSYTTKSPSPSPSLSPEPEPEPDPKTKYTLQAYTLLFPSHFSPRAKLGLSLAAIHGPVPHYAQKLGRSMDRFFARLGVGRCVKRENWSVSVDGVLFCVGGRGEEEEEEEEGHGEGSEKQDQDRDQDQGKERKEKQNQDKSKSKEKQKTENEEPLDLKKVFLRCERQTLHRLPLTGALVFAFKTYMYTLKEMRDEGSGEMLAEAIDGLERGNAPGIARYKNLGFWGEKVKAYLRGEMEA